MRRYLGVSLRYFPPLAGWRRRVVAHRPEKPGARILPQSLDGADRHTEFARGLLLCETNKETEVHHLGRARVDFRQSRQCLVQGQQLVIRHRRRKIQRVHIHPLEVPAAFAAALAPRRIDEDPPHGFSRGSKKMTAVLKPVRIAGEPQPGFVNERGGLQGLAGQFVGHLVSRQPAQLLVDFGQEFLTGPRVPVLEGLEQARDVGHAELLY